MPMNLYISALVIALLSALAAGGYYVQTRPAQSPEPEVSQAIIVDQQVSESQEKTGSPVPDTRLQKSEPAPAAKVEVSVAAPVPVPPPTVLPAITAYCTVENECAGFKIRIEFEEDESCGTPEASYQCDYSEIFSPYEKHLYYVTVRGDTVDGIVAKRNPNSGVETSWEDLLGHYNSQTGELNVWWGYYAYPNLMQGWVSLKTTGTIKGDQFAGGSNKKVHVKGDVTRLAISAADKIPKKTCLIKGDKGIDSGNQPTYYLTSSASYAEIDNPREWFCSETDAAAAGYAKSLR
jgi:hypothetical protein